MLTRARDNVGLPTLIVVVLLALAPLVIGSAAGQSVIIVAMIYAVGAVGLDLLTGYSGQFSFGQFVYFATGAYIMASLEINAHLTWWVALIIAVLGSGLLAGLVGAAMVRLRFFGSAVGTFFLGAAVVDIISGSHLARWTGASNGLPVAPVSLGSLALTSGYGLYYTVLTGLVLATALCVRYTKIRAGVAARVVKESEIVAASMGIRVFREKLRAQVTGGLLAGLGGCLLAMNLGYLSPDTFDVSQSIELFAIVAVGGTGSIAGPILGALFFFGVTNSLPSGSSSELVFAL
ncbi:MAG TPA: branched-chain amino acid ABC transporter permease, partial [Trebonia sp.]|nr:branched-chain amino acid ABC transporter permease [Trebonia sp.]